MELRDPETLVEGFEERTDEQLRAIRRRRFRFFLQGLSILPALLCSILVLTLAGDLGEERLAIGTVASPSVTGPPVLPKMTPDFDAEALQERLEEIAEGHEGIYGVVR